MSSPEVERFEVTEDDIDNEFNPNRRTFRQSKNQATYGVWADSEDEDERPGFGGRKRKQKDFTAPVSFISGGVKVGDKMQSKDEDNDSDEDFDVSQLRSRATLGGGSSSSGGSRSGFGGSRGGGRSFMNVGKDDMGHWEKHTKGIGQKLLEKMGFESGKGLGKNLQGISAPVEAFKRKGKAAIGFYGTERTERSKKDFPAEVDSEEEEEEKFKKQLSQWRKPQKGDTKRKKPKYVYKTADEIIASGGKKKTVVQSELAKVKVIDMTGKEKRVLSGYHALGHRHDMPDEEASMSPRSEKRAFDMPELLHNLDLLVGMTEDEIIQNNKKLQYEKDLIVNLEHEQQKLDLVCKQEEKQIVKVKEILSIVEICEKRMSTESDNPMNMEECAEVFQKLQDEFYEEYKVYELATLGVALVFPLMKKEFADWKPLTEPECGIDTLRQWRLILADSEQPFSQGEAAMGPYERLVWEGWMPSIRKAINETWSPRDCDSMITLLETWMPLLPDWILNNILDQLILPRLQKEVEAWNPLTDTMPIHAWLHPWLPLMNTRLEPLWAPIRHKLATALNNWHPSDPSAKMILQPWLNVWARGHTDAFLIKNIVPKLSLCLQEFIINPHQQHLDAWQWFLLWLDIIPTKCLASVLRKDFFPKWHKVLCTWLNANPNYEEVTKWYSGWKQMVPEQLLKDPGIKEEFNNALNVMNRAVTGQYQQPGARENVAYLASNERRPPPPPPPPPEGMPEFEGLKSSTLQHVVPANFKDLIAKKAEEYGLLFMPIPNKTYEAKQVYRFGHAQLYLDRGVIFMYNKNMWAPTSLQGLVNKGCAMG